MSVRRHLRARPAFSLVELMVVVAIIGVLTSLILVGINSMETSAYMTTDLAHHRMIAKASALHATDNENRLLHPRTEPTNSGQIQGMANNQYVPEIITQNMIQEAVESANKRLWVRAYDDENVIRLDDVDNGLPDTSRRELLRALSDGAAWMYMDGDGSQYRSPLDPTQLRRSYSLNAFTGSELCPDEWFGTGWSDPFYGEFARYATGTPTLSQIPQPANTFFSIIEWDPGHGTNIPPGRNFLGFMLHPNQATGYANYQIWHDIPGFWYNDKYTISMVDGSTRAVPISEPDLPAILNQHRVVHDGPDLRRIQQWMLPGVLEYRFDEVGE
ncbi:MAG: type II secretion system GspH family protein [Phycisphaerales bacterium]|nr:type II secretion system GspH family protein [Phycisphaerales bacterium]